MFTEISHYSSVAKLEGILKARYGMGLRLASIVDAQDIEVGDSKGELRGGALYVTICAQGKYLATAIMSEAGALSDKEVSNITELVRMVLEPTLYTSYINQKAIPVKDDHLDDSNLIPLFQREEPSSAFMHEGPAFLSSLLLLESENQHTVQRVAVHIHELGDRWALLNYNDVKSQIRSLKDLRELGAMTIVVNDLRELSIAEQETLAEFAKESNAATEPLILIGSPCSPKKAQNLQPQLAQELTRNHLELDRFPREFSRLQEALELFLDRRALLI